MTGATGEREDAVGVIELELLKLVRYLETLGRRIDLYVEVDRAGYVMLRTIDRLGAPSVGTLADGLHLDASTVTRQAARLEAAGLIDRQPGTDDRRSVSIRLTPDGRCVMQRVERDRRRELAALIGGWTEAERTGFAQAMQRLNLALEDRAGGSDDLERGDRTGPGAAGPEAAGPGAAGPGAAGLGAAGGEDG